MKKLILTAGLLVSAIAYSQTGYVGINTDDPAATLDVTGNPTVATKLDGVIAPRITGTQLSAKTYTTAQTGAIVYATAAAATADITANSQVTNVGAAGYYYYDGTLWQAMRGEPWNVSGTTQYATTNTQDIYQTGNIGIREKSPGSAISIVNDNQNDNYDDIAIETYSDGTQTPAFVYKSFAGTKAAPSNLANGAFLGSMYFRGYANNASTTLSAILSKYKGNGTTLLSNLEFYTSNQTSGADPKMILSEKGYLGVNELNPNSTLQVTGSVSNSIRTFTTSTSATNTDYFLLFKGTTTGQTLTIPASEEVIGRTYVIKNLGSVALTLSFPSATLRYISNVAGGGAGITSLIIMANTGANPSSVSNFNNSVKFIFDGDNWIQFN